MGKNRSVEWQEVCDSGLPAIEQSNRAAWIMGDVNYLRALEVNYYYFWLNIGISTPIVLAMRRMKKAQANKKKKLQEEWDKSREKKRVRRKKTDSVWKMNEEKLLKV